MKKILKIKKNYLKNYKIIEKNQLDASISLVTSLANIINNNQ